MKFFWLKILIRLIILTVIIGLTLLAFMDDRIIINRVLLLIILLISAGELFWFLNHTNRQLTLFVQALKNKDYTVRFPHEKTRGTWKKLNKSFQEVILEARDSRSAGEGKHQFLELAFDRLNAGVMTFDSAGKITQMNVKAGELLGTGRIHTLTALKRIHPSFAAFVGQSGFGQQTMELPVRARPVTLSIQSNKMRVQDDEFQLVVFHDIREALDAKEIESWTRLIRILTHEIMNSVTPIASLSESMYQQLARNGEIKSEIPPAQLEDLSFSLQTINRRSEGLLSFVEDYRKLTRVGQPVPQLISVNEFIDRLISLFGSEAAARRITFSRKIEPDSTLMADPVLLEQAMINLLKNSLDALENVPDGVVTFGFREEAGYYCLSIQDNGEGISEDELKEVFVPFFTTKKSGSGIGLSLTRQILHAHGGTIHLESVVNKGTECSLFFPVKNNL